MPPMNSPIGTLVTSTESAEGRRLIRLLSGAMNDTVTTAVQ